MILIPNNGVTNTQRPLLKIKLQQALPVGSQLEVLDGETVLGTATLASDQQTEPGLHYEFRHEDAAAGVHDYVARVVSSASTSTSPHYLISIVPPITPTVLGVYEQEEIVSGLFLSCPVFYDNAYAQQFDFLVRVVITPDEPSGTYIVTTNADANEAVLDLGIEVEHLQGNLTVFERLASENFDWWEARSQAEHNPQGTTWTLNWPTPSEQTSSAEVPTCQSGV